MDGLHVFLVVLLGVVSCSHDGISGSVLEVTVRPGDNITLYCDCKRSSGVYIVWYRNCSHENQPSLVLRTKFERRDTTDNDDTDFLNPFTRFHLVKNKSSDSYDLLIMNITDSDEGLYYCGTEQPKVEDKTTISPINVYTYGNATRIVVNSSEPDYQTSTHQQDCGVCWTLLLSLCPSLAVLSSLLFSLLVYQLSQKTAKEPQVDQQRPDTRGTTGNLVCL
ncbi:uncharacterized protein LOC122993339 [Thunnus albacares]|uniref:uncharacterized protein LOC122993339 n=1 Tax=Thunnus albacares TaxID=8236 RepID=UPI001CF713ED|nr:uncharacterized protein LOC122993339 [Thunnus albacares]